MLKEKQYSFNYLRSKFKDIQNVLMNLALKKLTKIVFNFILLFNYNKVNISKTMYFFF